MSFDNHSTLVPPIRVMVVDDSAIIRGLLQRALKEVNDIEIVASASSGVVALEKLRHSSVDIILLDIEMPEMDGMATLPKLLEISPKSRIIMVSTLTVENAEITLKALELGAADYIAKPSSRVDKNLVEQFYHDLIEKIHALAPNVHQRKALPSPGLVTPAFASSQAVIKPKLAEPSVFSKPSSRINAIAIGSSTGGPQALSVVLKGMSVQFPHVPVFITQHMPPNFTLILAKQLAVYAKRPCVEAKEGDIAQEGHIYVAPGDYHMVPALEGGKVVIHLNQNPPVNFCRPSVDPMLQALTRIYGAHLLVAILTGMGSDGLGGAREVVAARGTVIAQDEETSVVWGMPRAVADNNLCNAILPLESIAPYIVRACT